MYYECTNNNNMVCAHAVVRVELQQENVTNTKLSLADEKSHRRLVTVARTAD